MGVKICLKMNGRSWYICHYSLPATVKKKMAQKVHFFLKHVGSAYWNLRRQRWLNKIPSSFHALSSFFLFAPWLTKLINCNHRKIMHNKRNYTCFLSIICLHCIKFPGAKFGLPDCGTVMYSFFWCLLILLWKDVVQSAFILIIKDLKKESLLPQIHSRIPYS